MVALTYVPSVQANSFTIQVARIEDLVQESLQLNLPGLEPNKETLPEAINMISTPAQWLLKMHSECTLWISYHGRLEAAKTNTRSSERASPSICTRSSVFILRLPSCSPLEKDEEVRCSQEAESLLPWPQWHSKDAVTADWVPLRQVTPALPRSQELLTPRLEEMSNWNSFQTVPERK